MFDTEVGTDLDERDEVDELEAAIDKVAASTGPLDVARMCRLAERVEFLKLRAVGEFDRSCAWQADGFVSTASALRAKCQMTHGVARGAVDLARKLDGLPATASAFGAGMISRQHAAVIANAYTPERASVIAELEATLVAQARSFNARELRELVDRVTDALDGDGGAAADLAQYRRNRVNVSSTLYGRGVLDGSLDKESTEIVQCALDAMMHTLERDGDTRQPPERRAEALTEICRRSLGADHEVAKTRRRALPHLSMVVDIAAYETTHADLVADIRMEAEHVGRLSLATLERLTCDCSISRIITDGPSQIIDVGRTTRNIPDKLWKALVARDRHCTVPGCKVPPAFCEGHHIWYWSNGGPTDLANLQLLCWHHHRQRHLQDAKRE